LCAGRSAGKHIKGKVKLGRDRGEKQICRKIERHRNIEIEILGKMVPEHFSPTTFEN
jgi:hypothetical protein